NDLKDCAIRSWTFIAFVAGNQMGFGHFDVFQRYRARQCRALTHGRPVVDDGQPLGPTLGNRVPGAALIIQRNDRHEMGKQRARGIELAPVDQHMVVNGGAKVGRGGGVKSGQLGGAPWRARWPHSWREPWRTGPLGPIVGRYFMVISAVYGLCCWRGDSFRRSSR